MVTLIVYTWVFPPTLLFWTIYAIYMLPASKLISATLPPCQRQETFLLLLAKELFFQLLVFLAVSAALGWWFARGVSCAMGVLCIPVGSFWGGQQDISSVLLLWKKMVIWTLMKGALIQMCNFTQQRGYWWGSSSRAVSCEVGCAGLCLCFGPQEFWGGSVKPIYMWDKGCWNFSMASRGITWELCAKFSSFASLWQPPEEACDIRLTILSKLGQNIPRCMYTNMEITQSSVYDLQ